MKRFYVIAIIIIINSSFVFLIANNSIPSGTPYDHSHNVKKLARNLFPEGWGFFTRNPREEMVLYFKKRNDSLYKITKPCSDPKFFFGLNRDCRAVNAELQTILNQIEDSIWIQGNTSVLKTKNIDLTDLKDTLINYFHYPRIEGDILLVKQERLPWAWSKNRNNLKIPLKYLEVYVKRNMD